MLFQVTFCLIKNTASDTVGCFLQNLIEPQKSHGKRKITKPFYVCHADHGVSDMLENYKYGCIFCAAQGQTTAVHDKLDHLMVHIISKHKSTMKTPEIREKTKCIVGSVVSQVEDWDINVPESNQKGAGVVADEFFISASKFFNRRKGRRS
jgi:hypothetical protein